MIFPSSATARKYLSILKSMPHNIPHLGISVNYGAPLDICRYVFFLSHGKPEIWYNVGVFKMCMLDEIRAKRDEIYAIARKHKAEKLWVFGSCARKEERPDSDVDLLVKFGPQTTIFDYVRMQDDVSRLLGCGVDVVDSEALERERYFANEVQKDMVAI